MTGLPEDLNELPADIQNYMRKLAEMDIFLSGQSYYFINGNLLDVNASGNIHLSGLFEFEFEAAVDDINNCLEQVKLQNQHVLSTSCINIS